MTGILMLESLTRGNTLKQGDKTPLTYKLLDADGDDLSISGKSATVRLVHPNYLTIGYETSGITVSSDDTVTFTIDKVIPARKYHVEIIVDNKFVFPSRSVESKFTIDKSSLGTETNIIEIIGKDVLIREVKSQVDTDLQPLVTSLESAQQAEIQRASEESSRASAEEQRKIDHANRSAEFDGKADKVVLNKLISNDLSGYVRVTGTIDISDGIITMTPTSTGIMSQLYWDIDNLDVGDSIYIFSEAEYQDPEVNNVGITLKLGGVGITTISSYFTFNGSGKHEVSDIIKVNQITDDYRVYIEQNFNKATLPDTTTYLSKVLVVNLTKLFGAGNEPTKEQMDEFIKVTGYIDSENGLNVKEMLGYLLGNKANKKQEDWITPTFLNGSTGDIQFRKNQFGRVEFRGKVTGTQAGSVFALPTGYRPLNEFKTLAKTSAVANEARTVIIQGAGGIYFGIPYGTLEVHFDTISFVAE